jgi:hypothetical protein
MKKVHSATQHSGNSSISKPVNVIAGEAKQSPRAELAVSNASINNIAQAGGWIKELAASASSQ